VTSCVWLARNPARLLSAVHLCIATRPPLAQASFTTTSCTSSLLTATALRPGFSLKVCAIGDEALSPDVPLGVELEVLVRREDAERFVEEVRGDDPELAPKLRDRGAGARGGRAELEGCS